MPTIIHTVDRVLLEFEMLFALPDNGHEYFKSAIEDVLGLMSDGSRKLFCQVEAEWQGKPEHLHNAVKALCMIAWDDETGIIPVSANGSELVAQFDGLMGADDGDAHETGAWNADGLPAPEHDTHALN